MAAKDLQVECFVGPEPARSMEEAGGKTGNATEHWACEIREEAGRAGARAAVEANQLV